MAKNTFKFQTFANQISGIDIRKKTLYNIEHKNEMKNDEVSYFCETLHKWRTLNLTNEFVKIDKDLSSVQNLTQLIHQKETVCNYLVAALDKTTDDALQALLEIITAVARDLSEEFYPYFDAVFQHLTKLLQTKNAEKLEWTLKCVAQLFKILKKSIKKDFAVVFHKILPLLSSDEHIVNFIAECFAFVTREIGKQREFLVFVLDNIQEEHITGCGRLFFEMVHGVSNTFHLEAKPILTLLYDSLFDVALKRSTLYTIHVQLMTDMLELIDRKHLNMFLNIFYGNVKRTIETPNDKECLKYYLLLLGQLIEGSKFEMELDAVESIFKVFDCDVDDEVLLITSKIASAMILSRNVTVTDIICSRLSKKVMTIKNREIVREFVFATIDTAVFDVIIMPEFIRYVAKNVSTEMMEMLATVFIEKKCIQADFEAGSGSSFLYPNEIIAKNIRNSINANCNNKNRISSECIAGILCLPHICKSVDKSTLTDLLTLTTQINNKVAQECTKNHLILLLLLHRTRMKLSDHDVVLECVSTIRELGATSHNLSNLTAIQLLSTCLSILKKYEGERLDADLARSLKESLIRNLASHSADIRYFTIKCLSNLAGDDVYPIMLEIEQRPLDVFTYREHLVLYERLKLHALKDSSLEVKLSVLHFFYGILFKSFKLIWEPVMSVIAELSNEIPIGTFWVTFKEQLELRSDEACDDPDVECGVLTELLKHFTSSDESFDEMSHRQLLWRTLAKLDCCEMKNRDIVEIYLEFYQDEYLSGHAAEKCEDDDDDEEVTAEKTGSHSGKLKLLKAHLDVFLSFKNPSTIYKKLEVSETFKALITCRSKDVAVTALKCLLQCKYKNAPQDAHNTLIELLNGKMPEEVTKINKIIPPENRTEFIDIIMRIVHARLLSRPSKTDRITYLIHKRKVLGFLKNFTKAEINTFFHLAFDTFDEVDNKRINKKFLSANLQLLSLILSELSGSVDDDGVKFLLHLLVRVTHVAKNVEYEAEIRAKVLSCLCLVFEQFVEFQFTDEIYSEIFEVFIWPHLDSLENDCKVSASGLLKLFIEWSKNAKCFPLLERKKGDTTPIFHIMQLLKSASKEIKVVVYNLLTRIVEENSSVAEGTELLKPYHNLLLMTMKTDIQSNAIELDKLDIMPLLHILQEDQNITEINELVEIFLNVLNNRKTSRDVEKVRAILELISSTVHKISNVSEFLQKLSPLFDSITDIENRKLLCKVAKNMLTTEHPSRLSLYNIIEHFNALDRRWTNQPDYNRRYAAFTLIDTYFASHPWNDDFIHVVFHSCMHILTNDTDIFLRNQTNKYLFLMFNEMGSHLNGDNVKFLINNLFLPVISAKLRDTKVKCRSECIQLLGVLVSKYPDANSILADLKVFANRKEIEHDFFENITHLQENMQHKAIMKYVKMIQGEIEFQNQLTLVNFVLPIFSYYICNEEYRKKAKVIEAATMAISHTAAVLLWKNYEHLLKFYLGKLSKETVFRKQMINICVGILNSFHFKEECKNNVNDIEIADNQKSDRILKSIHKDIVPSLLKIMNAPSIKLSSQGTNAEKRDQKYNSDRENVLILSLAQALIKLLQKLPKSLFDQHFTSVIYKVTYFLKSNSKAVRIIAKDTLRKILIAVGPSYLEKVVNHLSSCLTRTNEIHVLTVNINSLIEAIRPSLKPTHLESVVQVILQICLNDIFRPTDSYRNGMRLLNRRNEVKPSKKSFLTLEMLAGGISEKCILDLIGPIKDKLVVAHSHMQVQKIQECFNKIVSGFCKNENITKEALLTLSYGVLSESIDQLRINKENYDIPEKRNKSQRNVPVNGDSLLIPAEPGRKGSVTNKVSKWKGSANSSLLTLFGLQILHILLKQKLIVSKQFKEYLDLHITTLQQFIESTEVKIKILSLKCMTCIWKFQYKSDTLIQTEPNIVKNIFEIVRKFVDQTIVRKDENLQLIKSAFKALIVFIKNVRPGVFVPAQIELMLSYVQNEMENPNENAMAFALLRAIIEKKLQSKTISSVAKKFAELSVFSDYEWVRNESKLIVQAHIKNYPSKLNEDFYIKFYCKHIKKEVKYLQPSSSIMVRQLVTLSNQEVLNNHWTNILEALSKLLVSKDLEHCETQLRDCIKTMFKRLSIDQLDNLYNMILEAFESDLVHNKRIAIKLCGCLLEVQKDFFSKKLNDIIPKLLHCLVSNPIANFPGKFVLLNHGNKFQDDELREKNKFLVSDTLTFSLGILDQYPLDEGNKDSLHLAKSIISSSVNFFDENTVKKIKLLFVQIIDKILTQIPSEKLMLSLKYNHEIDDMPFSASPHEELKDVLEKFVEEVHLTDSQENFIQHVLHIILLLGQTLAELFTPEMNTKQMKGLSYVWMCKLLREMLNKATTNVKTDHSTLVKTKIYECLEKVTDTISCDNVLILCKTLIVCLYKDMTDETNSEVKECSNKVWQRIVKKFENEPGLWSKVQDIYSHARSAGETEQRKKMSKRKALDIGVKPKKFRKV